MWSNPPALGHLRLQHLLAGMAEGRMADVVGEAQSLGQILVEAERPGHGAADLGDFEAVGEADPEMVAVGRDEDLGLVPEAAERDGMDDPVAVALEGVAGPPLARVRLARAAARATARVAGVAGRRPHLAGSFSTFCPAALVQAKPLRSCGLELVDEGLRLLGAGEGADEQAVGGVERRRPGGAGAEQLGRLRLEPGKFARQRGLGGAARDLDPDPARVRPARGLGFFAGGFAAARAGFGLAACPRGAGSGSAISAIVAERSASRLPAGTASACGGGADG